MSAPTPLPTHVYKILDAKPEDPLPAALPVSELDRKDGFVHLSTAAQVSLPLPPPLLPFSATLSHFSLPFFPHQTLYMCS